MSVKIKFTDERWERIERDWTAWWAHELDRPMIMIESMNFLHGMPEEYSQEFLLDKPVDELMDFYTQRLELISYYGDSWPKWWPNFGPGIMAGFLGANVLGKPDQRTVWFGLDKPAEYENLNFNYDPDNVWWRRIKEITAAAVERWGDRVSIAHTDLGGALDVLVSFRTGQNLLCDFIDAPDAVIGAARKINELWNRYYDELFDIIKNSGRGTTPWAPIWSPKRTYMLQCDVSYGISPKMFEKFVAPDLDDICSRLDHAFYHLDGKGQIPHLDILLSMKNLKGIQWIPGAGELQAEDWLPLLKRIRDGGKLCQVYTTQDGARKIVRELGGRGFAIQVFCWPPMNDEQIEDFLKEIGAK